MEEVETYSQQVINPSICSLLTFFALEELRAFACRHWGAQQLPWTSLAEPTAAFPGQLGCLGYNVGTPHSCQGLPLYMPPLAGHKKISRIWLMTLLCLSKQDLCSPHAAWFG